MRTHNCFEHDGPNSHYLLEGSPQNCSLRSNESLGTLINRCAIAVVVADLSLIEKVAGGVSRS